MRVCDISKREQVTSRVVVVEIPLDAKLDEIMPGEHRVIRDLEVGASAASAFEAGNWYELNQLTPYDERPKNEARRAAGRKAADSRRATKAEQAKAAREGE